MEEDKEVIKERDKAIAEYLRFLTTFSTGSLVLLVSFLDTLKAQPNAGYLIDGVLVALMVSTFTSVFAYSIMIASFGKQRPALDQRLLRLTFAIAWPSFLIAIFLLTIFGLVNI